MHALKVPLLCVLWVLCPVLLQALEAASEIPRGGRWIQVLNSACNNKLERISLPEGTSLSDALGALSDACTKNGFPMSLSTRGIGWLFGPRVVRRSFLSRTLSALIVISGPLTGLRFNFGGTRYSARSSSSTPRLDGFRFR